MIRNLQALGLSLLAVFVTSVIVVQVASADEFHADGERVVRTGTNEITVSDGAGGTKKETSVHEFAVGAAGTVKCTKVETGSTNVGTLVSAGTYRSHTTTTHVRPTLCTFGGQPATVSSEHCDWEVHINKTPGNTTGGEHGNLTLSCTAGNSVKIATSVCTLTVGSQEIKHAIRFENDKHNKNAINIIATAHGVVVGNLNDKGGCVLMPKGAVGKYIGTVTATCFRDDGSALSGTDGTTPTGLTTEGPETECKIA